MSTAPSAPSLPVDAERLIGEWVGHYPGHFDEFIRIARESGRLVAIKVTGDDFVPAGQVTWWADERTGIGEGHVAELGFVRPRYVPGRLTWIRDERIRFEWEGFGAVDYRKDD
jgi:hypothetical protein